jgi:hypothetical protein
MQKVLYATAAQVRQVIVICEAEVMADGLTLGPVGGHTEVVHDADRAPVEDLVDARRR